MTMLAEHYEYVIGGDPDRDTIDLAVLDTATGGARAHIAAAADGAGYARMLAWADRHAPGRRVWALEGTGSFAAGLAAVLALAGEDVVEVSGAQAQPRGEERPARCHACRARRDGPRSSREPAGARPARGPARVLRHPSCGPDQPHQGDQRAEEPHRRCPRAPASRPARRTLAGQLHRIEAMTTPPGAPVELRVTTLTLRSITTRIRFLPAQTAELDPELARVIRRTPPAPHCSPNQASGPSWPPRC